MLQTQSRRSFIAMFIFWSKIDGRYNDRGEQPQISPPQRKTKSTVAPDVTGLGLASVEPVLIPYTVTDADLQSVGPLPSKVAEQAKLKFLPYHDAADAIAEKFHSDVHFLELFGAAKPEQNERNQIW